MIRKTFSRISESLGKQVVVFSHIYSLFSFYFLGAHL